MIFTTRFGQAPPPPAQPDHAGPSLIYVIIFVVFIVTVAHVPEGKSSAVFAFRSL